MSITPKPMQNPIPFYVASFSETSSKMAAKRGHNIIYAPFAASMVYGSLAAAVDSYRNNCVAAGKEPGRAMCNYFIHIADTPEEDDFGRQAMMDYFKYCVLRAFPDDPETMPPTMHYFMQINEILRNMKGQVVQEFRVDRQRGSDHRTTERSRGSRDRRMHPVFQRR